MKTSARSPRANSTFKTLETRETYRMKEEILDILGRSHNGNKFSAATLADIGHKFGYCRPLRDNERIAQAHPYWKVLSNMSDPKSSLFVNNLEELNENGILCYRLRYDCYRKPFTGNWRKYPGIALTYKMPENR